MQDFSVVTAGDPIPVTSDLADRVVIVTGGSKGVGSTLVRALAERGASVAIADRSPPSVPAPGETLFVETDVTVRTAVEAMVETVAARFGRIDVLVNNAARYRALGQKVPFDKISSEDWDDVMAVNVRGPWECIRALAARLRAQRSGRIINIASTSALIGSSGFAHYVASKAALIGLTRAIARELGPYGVTVNAIASGLIANAGTEELNTPAYLDEIVAARAIPRAMTAEDLVGTVVYLASGSSDFVTGQTFIVDGGHVLR
jgi:NAD(P)-dependent dehydrogenase (short-subunit alcohol dehydrogenase family)